MTIDGAAYFAGFAFFSIDIFLLFVIFKIIFSELSKKQLEHADEVKKNSFLPQILLFMALKVPFTVGGVFFAIAVLKYSVFSFLFGCFSALSAILIVFCVKNTFFRLK